MIKHKNPNHIANLESPAVQLWETQRSLILTGLGGLFLILVLVIPILVIRSTALQNQFVAIDGGTKTGSLQTITDSSASGGDYTKFTSPAPAPTPTPPTPSPTPPPASGSFCTTFPAVPSTKPDATSTGVPAGTALTASGDITANTAGMIINAKDINGGINVAANNVTIQNSKIHPTSFNYSDGASGAVGIAIADGVTGTKIIRNEIYSSKEEGYIGINGGDATVCGNNIHGFQNGMTIGNAMIVQANYIHNLNAAGAGAAAPHYDGIEIYFGSNHKIYGNHITMTGKTGNWLGETNAINLTAYQGNISGTVINGNWVGGGSYSIGVRQQNTSRYSNVTVTNNRIFGTPPKGFASGGPCDIQPTPITTGGNVWDASGQAVCN
jgi:hypothetical protein